ncbi:hypothetical protein M9H77_30746 [Catharanthus roseus]|uniref:Uncharacterized protein n=1 Tax=Catharanthus roseus TaxID=4058 RepID=A0ACB9ZYF7_CATRO|nr:hypothetical protein M9H77_30746 [Catharanthus roseus]
MMMPRPIGQLVKLVPESYPGTLLNNTKVNSREHVNAISARFDEEIPKEEKVMIVQIEESCIKKERRSFGTLDSKPPIVEYKLKIPYPVSLVRDRNQENIRKFIEIFKQLKINLPLYDLLM